MVVGGGKRRAGRVLERLEGRGPVEALLAGFLVGETRGVPDADMEALRRAGLAHLVAVSGSNVSLFLTLTVIALGPLGAGPRRRAVFGLVALAVLVVATRWEPSVIRASIMAALLLGGRLFGWALRTLTALAVTVALVVVISGELSTDVGFAMSVLATFGVVAGARLRPEGLPRPVSTLVGATCGAQLAVAPVVLSAFGTMPLLAPITNLVAIPTVSAASASGAVGVALSGPAHRPRRRRPVGAGGGATRCRLAASRMGGLRSPWRRSHQSDAVATTVSVVLAAAVAWSMVGTTAGLPRRAP